MAEYQAEPDQNLPTQHDKILRGLRQILRSVHGRVHAQAKAVQPDEARGVVLIVGFGGVGLHRRDVRIVEALF